MNPLDREPVLTLDLVKAALALAVGFGLDLTGEQVALVLTFTSALLAFVARSRVSPVQ